MTDSAEARRSRRYSCRGPIQFRIHNWQITGKLINLCLEGCLIRPNTELSLAVGDQFDLRFEVNHLTFRAQCVVRWIAQDQRLGVEILMISERGRTQLIDLLEELAATPLLSSSDTSASI
ncbi:PilZ domain-containing protein [Edaphobacter bradus]|uniref:PilZ domain-containing protein n=1 Tax=Edaphobacter bradus TaxID=2259016 RepID=UPI0021E02B37|nr:PilZ domain-containing protein [Edaphobacter bradus]